MQKDLPTSKFDTRPVDKDHVIKELQKIMNLEINTWLTTSQPIPNLNM